MEVIANKTTKYISDLEKTLGIELDNELKTIVIEQVTNHIIASYADKMLKVKTRYGMIECTCLFNDDETVQYILNKKAESNFEGSLEKFLETVDIGLINKPDNSGVYTGLPEIAIKYFDKYGLDQLLLKTLYAERYAHMFNSIEYFKKYVNDSARNQHTKELLSGMDVDIENVYRRTYTLVNVLGEECYGMNRLISVIANHITSLCDKSNHPLLDTVRVKAYLSKKGVFHTDAIVKVIEFLKNEKKEEGRDIDELLEQVVSIAQTGKSFDSITNDKRIKYDIIYHLLKGKSLDDAVEICNKNKRYYDILDKEGQSALVLRLMEEHLDNNDGQMV